MEGIFNVTDFGTEIDQLRTKGFNPGVKIGWLSLDELYRIKLGMFTVITGIPGHGKSEWLDAVLVRLAGLQNWRFCYFSPENYPLSIHFTKLAEKTTGLPFHEFPRSTIESAKKWIGDHFTWLYPANEESVDLDWILERARFLAESTGLHGLVIDPWNEIEHNRGSISETDYISQSLSKIRRFARKYDVHVWIIAHPFKLTKDRQTNKYPVPTPYDISGSAHWRNKLDFCVTVHRPNIDEHTLDVHVQKVKFKHLGKVGSCTLLYDYRSGTFADKSSV